MYGWCNITSMTKLNDLVIIIQGYSFRESVLSLPSGDVAVIQSGDLDLYGNQFFGYELPKIKFENEKYLLQENDVLLSAKGFSKAMVFRNSKYKSIITSSLFILRPKNDQIDSDYLAAYFNSIEGIKTVLRLSSGSSVRSITKIDLADMEIPTHSLIKQKTIGEAVKTIHDILENLDTKKFLLDSLKTSITSKAFKEIK